MQAIASKNSRQDAKIASIRMSTQENASREDLLTEIARLKEVNAKLSQQNMKLVLLNKERDIRLFKCEGVIRRYRSRLVRWFEDMKYDPLTTEDPLAPGMTSSADGDINTFGGGITISHDTDSTQGGAGAPVPSLKN